MAEEEKVVEAAAEAPKAEAPAEPKKATHKLGRFMLTFWLGFIGSFIINHSHFKQDGWKSRTAAYLFLGIITFGIYDLVASICNFGFDPNKAKNVGYKKVN